jgi:hypothetical protein
MQTQHDPTRAVLLTQWAQEPGMTAAPVLACLESWAPRKRAAKAGPRNLGQFIPRKAGRALRAVLPSWAVGVFTVCLVVPGPFDEIAAALAAAVLVVVRFRRAASAWRGGKTRRVSGSA